MCECILYRELVEQHILWSFSKCSGMALDTLCKSTATNFFILHFVIHLAANVIYFEQNLVERSQC